MTFTANSNTLYCATAKGEETALQDACLDEVTNLMVKHQTFDLNDSKDYVNVSYCNWGKCYVVWELVRKEDGLFYFNRVIW